MKQRRVGIRELKSKLSECVRDVKQGAIIVVTEHGRPVARLVPEAHTLDERLNAMTSAGVVAWSGRRLRRTNPDAHPRKNRTVSDVLVENRE